jgi:hypothetical protein
MWLIGVQLSSCCLMARTEGLLRAILGPMPDLVIAMLVFAVMATVMGAII